MVISHKYKIIFIKTTKIGGTSLELFLDTICGSEDVLTPHWHEESGYHARNYKGIFNPIPECLNRIKNSKNGRNVGIKKTISDLINRRKYFENIPAWQLKNRVSSEIWESYFKFTIERNPWDKCVSRYFHSKEIYESKYKKELSFSSWFSYFEQRLEQPWLTRAWGSEAPFNFPRYANPWSKEIMVDKIVRYENMQEELTELFNSFNIPFEGLEQIRAKGQYRKDRRPYTEFFNQPDNLKYISKIENIFQDEIRVMKYSFE